MALSQEKKGTIAVSLTNFLDSGCIVASGVALAAWAIAFNFDNVWAVSYTHLDVYKRQPANYFVRDVVEIVVSAEDEAPAVPGEADEHPNSPNAGVLTGAQE